MNLNGLIFDAAYWLDMRATRAEQVLMDTKRNLQDMKSVYSGTRHIHVTIAMQT